jgi:SAM-dependent methyltransferase
MSKVLSRAGDQDAYGHEVWDYYQAKPAYEIIERDDGYINTSQGPKVYFSPYDEWRRIEKESLEYAKGRVLDVGCSAGRIALHLQNEKRLDVLGIDNSPLAVKVSKLRGMKKVQLLDFHKIAFPPDSFDTIVMFGNNFGLFSSPGLAKKLLRKLFVMTSSDGVIICQSVDPY